MMVSLRASPRPPGSAWPSFLGTQTFCEAELTLFASFSGKRRKWLYVEFCWGHAPRPPGFAEIWAANLLRSRTNAFCFFFWKKKKVALRGVLLGARPQTPWVGFAEIWAANLLRSRTNAFCFFFWKKKKVALRGVLLGARPQTPWVGFAEIWAANNVFCFFYI
jgi:hypothetical protein